MSNTVQRDGEIAVPEEAPAHRDAEYDPWTFELLLTMQRDHFWYRGRHRFLLAALRRAIDCGDLPRHGDELSAVDMGGGCGGWLEYLHAREPGLFSELALADSSPQALDLAGAVVGTFASRHHVDLLQLRWENRWDVVFLLDVLEHIPEHVEVLRQVRHSLRPGGLLFVTTPALRSLWTYNDELVRHQRRYSRREFGDLAHAAGLTLKRSTYFMFFLGTALYVTRKLATPPEFASEQAIHDHLARTHRIPPRSVNAVLEGIFSLEALLSGHVRFPWGTSILGIFQKPEGTGA